MSAQTSFSRIKSYIPSDHSIVQICTLLSHQFENERNEKKYAKVKTVLTLLGKGAIITAAILAPKSASILLPLVKESSDWDEWKKYNVSYLKRTLEKLEKQKEIEVVDENGEKVLRLTKNGKRKVLKYSIDSMIIDKPKHWDGKWRMVIYDIPSSNRKLSNIIRSTLDNLGFYQMQKSVYLLPYHCFDQIEFLRQYYGLGDHIQYIVIEQIENDDLYKTYFGLS